MEGEARASRIPNVNLDRWVPWVAAMVLFILYFMTASLRAYTFEAGYDVGYFRQAAYLLGQAEDPFITVRGLHLFADHAYFIMVPIGWMTRVIPPLPLLFGLQAGALAIAVVPIWRIGRGCAGLSIRSASLLIVAYAFYPAVLNVNSFDFHPEVLAIPALVAGLYFGLEGRWKPYTACILLALLSREDMAIVVAFVGVSLVLAGKRRAGIITGASSVLWFLFTSLIFTPRFTEGSFSQIGSRYPRYGSSTIEVLLGLVTHPHLVIKDIISEQNLLVVIALLGPLLFLPILAPRVLLPGVPLQALYLISNVPAAHTIDAQYTVAAIPFVFVATAFALGGIEKRSLRAIDGGLVVAVVASTLLFSFAFTNARPWQWIERDVVDDARLRALTLVPEDASVSATTRFWPYVADRAELFAYPMPFYFYDDGIGDPMSVSERRAGVEYLLLDTSEFGVVYGDADAAVLFDEIPELGFEEIFDEEGIVVYRRQSLPIGSS